MFRKILFTLLFIALSFTVFAQEKKVRRVQKRQQKISRSLSFEADAVAMLKETSSILTEENGKTIVKFMPPKMAIDKNYQDVDLKANDEILFINGKKVKKLDDFKKVYNDIKIGSEIELGIKRKNEKFFVKLFKADPSKLKSKMKLQTQTN